MTRTRPQFAPQPLRGSSAGAGRLPGPARREGKCREPGAGARREDPTGPGGGKPAFPAPEVQVRAESGAEPSAEGRGHDWGRG